MSLARLVDELKRGDASSSSLNAPSNMDAFVAHLASSDDAEDRARALMLIGLLKMLADKEGIPTGGPVNEIGQEVEGVISNVLNNYRQEPQSGSISSTTIPDNDDGASLQKNIMRQEKPDYDADVMVITSIPSKPLGGPADDPDGHSEWLVHGPTKAKLLNTPGFLQPVPKPKLAEPAYIIKSTPGKGVGLFATHDIKMGELIFAERPLLVTPISNYAVVRHLQATYPDTSNLTLEKMMKMAMSQMEEWLQMALERMEPEDKKAYTNLANSHKHDGSGPLYGVVRTNCFGLGPELYDGDKLRDDQMNGYGGVTKIGSRINHSCMPNVHVEFSKTSFSFQFTALIDIKSGEEFLYSYCPTNLSVAERRARHAPYGFRCHCDACEHATPETDALRKDFDKRANHYMLKLNWAGKGGPKESVIDPVVKLHDGLVKEGLTYTTAYKKTLLMLRKFYEGIGMEEKAQPYREKYEKYKHNFRDY